jgi:SAM-dependent methyltransferase
MWDKGWDKIFEENEWGKYPEVEVIRFVSRNFYSSMSRCDIKILEVGCGTGANLWYLAKEGFHTTGVDGSHVGIRNASLRLEKEGLNAEIIRCDAMNLPFESATFDGVIDNECIYANTYGDSETILDEVRRVLKCRGVLFSKTFMTGMTGDRLGETKQGEENTYTAFKGPLRQGYGIIRLTSESEVSDLYGSRFHLDSVDYVIRSDHDQTREIKEWIIHCTKK